MKVHVPQELEVPEDIIGAAINGNLTFFIGNSLSRLYGYPSWDELANRMLGELAKHKIINYSILDILKTRPIKEKISIADSYYKDKKLLKEKNLESILTYNNALTASVRDKNLNVYKELVKCGLRFITTNYDLMIDDALTSNWSDTRILGDMSLEGGSKDNVDDIEMEIVKYCIFDHPDDLVSTSFLGENVLLHLHGSTQDEKKLVSSTSDYLKLYSDKKFQEKLIDILENQIIVFIGYGLEELEVLELIFRSAKKSAKHFYLLLPVKSYEEPMLECLKKYWEEQLGIKLLPFNIDERGYHAIKEIIEKWSSVLYKNSNNSVRFRDMNFIDEKLEKFNNLTSEESRGSIISEIVDLIYDNYKNLEYFFLKVENSDWFRPLEKRGFFEYKPSSELIKNNKKKDFIWPQISYLKKIAFSIKKKKITKNEDVLSFIGVLRNFNFRSKDSFSSKESFEISLLMPLDLFTEEDLENIFDNPWWNSFKGNEMESIFLKGILFEILKNYSDSRNNNFVLLELLKKIFSCKESDTKFFEDFKFKYFEKHSVNIIMDDFCKKVKEDSILYRNLIKEFVIILSSNLESILKSNKDVDEMSAYWRPAIEENAQNKFCDSPQSLILGGIKSLLSLNEDLLREFQLVESWKNQNIKHLKDCIFLYQRII